jgi:hypothetical protein
MTPGNNGASTPEDDDPFGYLYADGQAAGAQPPSGGGGYGYPGSVNRVRPVGERQYGQSAAPTAPTAQYGQVPQQQGTYGQPNANYSAPEAFPGGEPTTYQPMPDHGQSRWRWWRWPGPRSQHQGSADRCRRRRGGRRDRHRYRDARRRRLGRRQGR